MAPDDMSAPLLVNGALVSGQPSGNSPVWYWNGSPEPDAYWSLGTLAAGTVVRVTMHADSFAPAVDLLYYNGTTFTGPACQPAEVGSNDITCDFTVPAGTAGYNWIVVATASAMVNGNFVVQVQYNPALPVDLVQLSYAYYPDGSVKSVSDNYGGVNSYQYDSLSQLTEVQQWGNYGTTSKQAAFTYNADGQANTVVRTIGINSAEVATTTSSYDAMGDLDGLVHSQRGSTITGYTFSYDDAGLMTQMTSVGDGTTS